MNRPAVVFILTLFLPLLAVAYPLDGYQDTGIRRVEGARLANEGVIPGTQTAGRCPALNR